jgi:MFS family permease
MARRSIERSLGPAFRFVLVMGLVNLFADTTYEGGAGINGPFLGSLGATAAATSMIAGLGEFLGYAVRPLSGWIADRTGRHWPITFVGYAINLLAVPAMALAGSWQVAALLVLAERIGRAIRKPTVEAMLSYAAGRHRRGWVYAVNTAMDETGATIGPLLMALVLARDGSYRTGYGLLLGSSLLALVSLGAARVVFPDPSRLATGASPTTGSARFGRGYRLTMLAGSLFAAGLMSFEFIAWHLSSSGVVTGAWVPAFLAIATAGGVVASLVLGRLYDRLGTRVVVAAVCLTALFPPLVFFGGFGATLAGLLLWGVGYATQDTLLKALIAGAMPEGRRNLAFGLFYLGYGGGWLLGSVTAGLLYERSRLAVVVFAVAVLLASVPLFVAAGRQRA